MLHAGLDLSRRRVDVCLLSDRGELVAETAAPADVDGLRGLVERVAGHRQPVRAVIESMNGARFVHDSLEERGWEVLVADAHKGQGSGAVGVQDRQDRRAGPGRALPARSGAGDLAARPMPGRGTSLPSQSPSTRSNAPRGTERAPRPRSGRSLLQDPG